jgi:phospholipid-binding lipoprotein MlaA
MQQNQSRIRQGSLAVIARFSSLSRRVHRLKGQQIFGGSLMRACRLRLLLPAALAAALVVSGCAAPHRAASPDPTQAAFLVDEFNDPFEETNRAIFGFNQVVDRAVLVPVAKTYRTVVPPPMRQSLRDFLRNLNGPVIFANDVLQGRLDLAAETFGRLAVNTTIGFGGMFDVATRIGIPHHPNDLGVTLATWGFDEGPYVMVPVLGPSNPRDLIGMVGDSFIDPADYFAAKHNLLWAAITRSAVSGIDVRSRNIESLADIERTALDYYATIRSLYRQRRAAQIRHEHSTLPNPTPVQGGDAGPDPSLSYFIAQTPTFREVPAK